MFFAVNRASVSSFLFKLNSHEEEQMIYCPLHRLPKSAPFLFHTMKLNELVSFQENPCTHLNALSISRYFQNA